VAAPPSDRSQLIHAVREEGNLEKLAGALDELDLTAMLMPSGDEVHLCYEQGLVDAETAGARTSCVMTVGTNLGEGTQAIAEELDLVVDRGVARRADGAVGVRLDGVDASGRIGDGQHNPDSEDADHDFLVGCGGVCGATAWLHDSRVWNRIVKPARKPDADAGWGARPRWPARTWRRCG